MALSGGDLLLCLEREPAPPPPPARGRVCIELNGHLGPDCWPDLPAPLPADAQGRTFKPFLLVAARLPDAVELVWTELEAPEWNGTPSEGYERSIEEPPRS